MKKYLLKSNAGLSTAERPLDDFNEEDFKKWNDGTLSKEMESDLQQQAEEDQNFEWWIEEVTE
jgi:hypothetical protein